MITALKTDWLNADYRTHTCRRRMHSLLSRAAHLCARCWLFLAHVTPTRPPLLRQYVVPRSAHGRRFSQAAQKVTRRPKSSFAHSLLLPSSLISRGNDVSVLRLFVNLLLSWVKIGSPCRRPHHPPRPRRCLASVSPAVAVRTRARFARATVATVTSTVTRTATGHRSQDLSRETGFVRHASPADVPQPPTSPPPTSPPSCKKELLRSRD